MNKPVSSPLHGLSFGSCLSGLALPEFLNSLPKSILVTAFHHRKIEKRHTGTWDNVSPTPFLGNILETKHQKQKDKTEAEET